MCLEADGNITSVFHKTEHIMFTETEQVGERNDNLLVSAETVRAAPDAD